MKLIIFDLKLIKLNAEEEIASVLFQSTNKIWNKLNKIIASNLFSNAQRVKSTNTFHDEIRFLFKSLNLEKKLCSAD